MTKSRFRNAISVGVLLYAVVRFVGAIVSGRNATYGDLAATLPGGYVKELNPVLWNSPDLSGSWMFHSSRYLHGPTQYLTLYPIAFLNSYAAIARVLLVVYVPVVLLTLVVIWQVAKALGARPSMRNLIWAATLLYYPLLEALGQREFEVILLLAFALLFWAAVRNHLSAVGALLAYAAWFKYLPLGLLPYVVARRWRAALVAFVVASVVWLGAAQLLFGLQHFAYGSRTTDTTASVPTALSHQLRAFAGGLDFCGGIEPVYRPADRTYTSLRWGLCAMRARVPWLPLPTTFLVLSGVILVLSVVGFVRHERVERLGYPQEPWRRALELSLVLTAVTTWFLSHYYYFSVLLLPLVVLWVRAGRRPLAQAFWGLTYLLLSPFVLPVSVMQRVIRVDPLDWYTRNAVYLFGVLCLTGTLLYEYLTATDVPASVETGPGAVDELALSTGRSGASAPTV